MPGTCIAHVKQSYLPFSETFVYQIVKAPFADRSVVICQDTQNLDVFPFSDLITFPYPNSLIAKVLTGLRRATKVDPHASSMTAPYREKLKAVGATVVFAHSGPAGVRVMGACKELNIPLIVQFWGFDFAIRSIVEEFSRQYSELFKIAGAVVCGSEFAKGRIMGLGCPSDKLHVIKWPVDCTSIEYKERLPKACGDAVSFVGVGRIVEKKGMPYAIEAMKTVSKQVPNCKFTQVGGGDDLEKFREIVVREGLSEHVTLMGAQPHSVAKQVLGAGDILIMPSVTATTGDVESQGIALQEGQAAGLPVIATIHNGFPEGMIDGETGFLVPERDAEALAERMIFLATNQALWADMGRKGRAFVEANYQPAHQVKQFQELISQVAQKRLMRTVPPTGR